MLDCCCPDRVCQRPESRFCTDCTGISGCSAAQRLYNGRELESRRRMAEDNSHQSNRFFERIMEFFPRNNTGDGQDDSSAQFRMGVFQGAGDMAGNGKPENAAGKQFRLLWTEFGTVCRIESICAHFRVVSAHNENSPQLERQKNRAGNHDAPNRRTHLH